MRAFIAALAASFVLCCAAICYASLVVASQEDDMIDAPTRHQFGALVSDKLQEGAWHE